MEPNLIEMTGLPNPDEGKILALYRLELPFSRLQSEIKVALFLFAITPFFQRIFVLLQN
jgi:hypothetical protein